MTGAPEPARYVLDVGRRLQLWVFDAGLACCAVEFLAAAIDDSGAVPRLGALPMAGDVADADVLVVSGTVTDKLAPAVRALYDRLPEPKHVVSFGACANSGGPYWDSYCVTAGVDQLLPVDVWVPGCPPRPEALRQALLQLQDGAAGGAVPASPDAGRTSLLGRA